MNHRPTLDELLLKTSRTFALSIPTLPEPTRREVMIAYLLFRIADTLEDATVWPASKQTAQLDRFAGLLEHPSEAEAQKLAAHWIEAPPLEHEGYLELLSEMPRVMGAYLELAEPARQLIGKHTGRTCASMAAFVDRKGQGDSLRLADIPDLQAYCYAVAGIVGEMLTELFLLGRRDLLSIADGLRRDAATFGEALQLVNILKDSASDAEEGRRYMPMGVDRSEVFALARRDLDTATGYVLRLQDAGAPRGLVEFTATPVLLALATLDRVEEQGPGAKITRSEVMAIVRQLSDALDHSRPAI